MQAANTATDAIAWTDLHLSPEETTSLDEASDLHAADYPYGVLGVDQRHRAL